MRSNLNTSLWGLGGSFKVFILMLLGIAFLTASCSKNDDEDIEVDAAALNVVNVSPGPLSINFFLDNQLVNGPALAFTQQTGYLLAYTGQRKFDATVGGTTQVVATQTLNLEKDKYYTLFFAGLNTSPEIILTEDDLTDPAAGKAKIRFINLSPDATALNLSVSGGATLFTNISYKTASGFISIDPATYNLRINTGETTMDEITSVQIEAGKVYTVWAYGLVAGTGTTAFNAQVQTNR